MADASGVSLVGTLTTDSGLVSPGSLAASLANYYQIITNSITNASAAGGSAGMIARTFSKGGTNWIPIYPAGATNWFFLQGFPTP